MLMNPFGLPVASAQSTGAQYTMTFINNSNNSWSFCCYQNGVAWFVAQVVHPTTSIRFQWTIDYGLSWSQCGTISPGIVYFPAQNWSVTPTLNTVTLTKLGGSYTFQDLRQQAPQTAFTIVQDGTIVVQDGIGIGISMQITGSSSGGAGLNTFYALSAQPNMTTQFTPMPKYSVVFAQAIQPSQILDVATLTNTVEVTYAPSVYSMTVNLNAQNQWSVGTTADINAKYLQEVKRNPDVDWLQVAADACQLVEGQS